MVSAAVARADIVITTANIPGRTAPLLITKETVAQMRPGAVIVDLAAESGGNCELTRLVRASRIMGSDPRAAEPPGQVPFHSSQMYAKNLQSFLALLVDKDGAIIREFTDEILTASLLVHAGEVRHRPTRDTPERREIMTDVTCSGPRSTSRCWPRSPATSSSAGSRLSSTRR